MSSTKGKTLYFNEKSKDYVTFGKGKQPLVIIPGLGDGLQTVKGKAKLFFLSYIWGIPHKRHHKQEYDHYKA